MRGGLATLTLYYAYAFFTSGKAIAGVSALIFAILAGLTKGTGLVVFLAVLTTAALLLLLGRGAPALSRRLGYLAIVPTVGPYGTHYLKYGSPFTLNDQKFIEGTTLDRPGVTSIPGSFLTFRLLGMLRDPMITDHPTIYPLHRTSFWSQLYGRTHFVHFDQTPSTWESRRPLVRSVGRGILILALLPTLLFVAGLFRSAAFCARSMLYAPLALSAHGGMLLMTVASLGQLGFVVVAAWKVPDFSMMKAIYAFPGLLARRPPSCCSVSSMSPMWFS